MNKNCYFLDGDEFFKTGVSVLSSKADPFDDDWSKLVSEKQEEPQTVAAAQLAEEVVEPHKEEVEEPLSSPPQMQQQQAEKIEKPHTPSEKKGNKKKGRKH